jgi:hypothetical protein
VGSGNGASLWALCEENLDGGSFTEDPEGYVEKALEAGMSLHRDPNREAGRGLIYLGLFERRMKGTLRVERLSVSLSWSSVKGTWWGTSLVETLEDM